MSWTVLLPAAVAGLVAAHLLRRATPWLAGVRGDRRPFSWAWLELAGAGSFALVASVYAWASPQWYLFTLLLLAVTATDFHVKLIPDRVSFPGIAAGVALAAIAPDRITGFLIHEALLDAAGLPGGAAGGLALSVAGAAVGFGLLEGFRRLVGACVGMEVLGMGDSKLLALTGSFLGPAMVLLSLAPALVAGIVLGIPYTRLARTPHLPFGPALALGGFLTLLYSHRFRDAWVAFAEGAASLPPWAARILSLLLIGVAVGLLIRVRRRREEYSRRIEEDYEKLEKRE